jgi:hypothetical protein
MTSLLATWWVQLCDTVTGGYLSRRLRPDDRLFVAMLAAWVVLDAVVSCALLGWQGAFVLVFVGGLVAVAAVLAQSKERARSSQAAAAS